MCFDEYFVQFCKKISYDNEIYNSLLVSQHVSDSFWPKKIFIVVSGSNKIIHSLPWDRVDMDVTVKNFALSICSRVSIITPIIT